MTLVVCLKADQGIILAADSRGTVGDPRGLTAINDTYVKIFPLGCCGVGMSGASEQGAALLDELQKNGAVNTVTNIDEASQLVAAESAKLFNQWFGAIQPPQRPGVLVTLAGYRASGEAMVYLMSSQTNFAPQLFGHMPCMSGVPQYAVYLVHRYYNPEISLENAKALAAYLITETASQDPKVGGPVRIAQITATEGYQQLTDEEVEKINAANEEVNKGLREFFLKGGPK